MTDHDGHTVPSPLYAIDSVVVVVSIQLLARVISVVRLPQGGFEYTVEAVNEEGQMHNVAEGNLVPGEGDVQPMEVPEGSLVYIPTGAAIGFLWPPDSDSVEVWAVDRSKGLVAPLHVGVGTESTPTKEKVQRNQEEFEELCKRFVGIPLESREETDGARHSADPKKPPVKDGMPIKDPAGKFTTDQMLTALLHRVVEPSGAGYLVLRMKKPGSWVVSAEYGREAPDSPMFGGAVYGLGDLRKALRVAGADAGLWTEKDAGDPGQRPLRILLLEGPEGAEPAEVDPSEAVQGSMELLADADEAFVFRGDRVVALKHRDREPEDVHVAIQRRQDDDVEFTVAEAQALADSFMGGSPDGDALNSAAHDALNSAAQKLEAILGKELG